MIKSFFNKFTLVVCVLPLLYNLYTVNTWKWLEIAKMTNETASNAINYCNRAYGLSRRQMKFCQRNTQLMKFIAQGAQMSIDECQKQFKNRRWNCTSQQNSKSFLGNFLTLGTREAAFIHSLSSSGIAYVITKACSNNNLNICGCDETLRGNSKGGFYWSGCSDNVNFGVTISSMFTDPHEKRKKPKTRHLMNLHNNNAGRLTIKDLTKIRCKCHGVSGSCEFKTCWKSLPAFKQIGNALKEKFNGATEVKKIEVGSKILLLPRNKYHKLHSSKDLIYLKKSPSFCEMNAKVGSIGTRGRECTKDSSGVDGCDLLCCSRGFRSLIVWTKKRCRCKFQWCCHVTCDQCIEAVEKHYCL